jgi:WD domain, G-beta repeat
MPAKRDQKIPPGDGHAFSRRAIPARPVRELRPQRFFWVLRCHVVKWMADILPTRDIADNDAADPTAAWIEPGPPATDALAEIETAYEYDAFVSYRRRDATALAQWIRDRLRHYRLPPEVLEGLAPEKRDLHERRPRIWLDKAYEKPSDDFLTKKIYPALDQSARLVVVSTSSVFSAIRGRDGIEEPNWLVREIEHFLGDAKADRSPRPIDVVLGPGGTEDRFPGRLAEKDRWDWIDLRAFTRLRSWRLNEELDAGLCKLVAGLYDIPDSQLPALRREEQRRRTRFWATIAVIALVVASAIGISGVHAWHQRNQAIAQRDQAYRNESQVRTEQARKALADGFPVTAMQLALAGLPNDPKQLDARPWVGETPGALVEAMGAPRELKDLRGHEGTVYAAGFSPDGARIVSGSGEIIGGKDNTVRVWDAASGKELLVLRGHEDQVNAAGFSPDGARIVSGSEDNTLRVWDAASGQELLVLRGHEGSVTAAEFSPDGTHIVSGSYDQTVRVWPARGKQELIETARVRLPRELTDAEKQHFHVTTQ